MINRAYIELESVKDCSAIARIDGRLISSDTDGYVKENLFSYYLAINTWLIMVNDFSTPAYLRIKTVLHKDGLVASIKRFVESADELVHGEAISDDLVRNVLYDIERARVGVNQPRYTANRQIWSDPMATSLFVCRYLKRFCPLKADKYDRQVIDGFLSNQNRIKMLQRRPVNPYLLPFVKEEMEKIRFDLILQDIRNLDITDLEITHGVGFDAKAPLVSKLKALRKSCPSFFYQPFGVNMTPCTVEDGIPLTYGRYNDEKHVAKVSCVPKSYKANRMIAMEDTYRQAYAKAIFRIVDKYLPDNLSLHNQERNQELARIGSLDQSLATLDLHAASDSVSWVLCKEVFPREFCKELAKIRPTHILANSKEKPIYAFATMGNAMTFVVELLVFWAISKAACHYANLWGINNSEYVSVYGDDIVCPTVAAEMVIEWLEAFGFVVNHEKSFFTIDSAYRESCGEEYYLGTCVSSQYYPRFSPRGTITATSVKISTFRGRDGFTEEGYDSTSRLIDLQHKLAYLSDNASLFLAEIIREADPKMTCSPFGTVCSDLWDYESRPVLGRIPLGEIVTECGLKRVGNKYYPTVKRSIKPVKSDKTREGHSLRVDTFTPVKEDKLGMRLYELYKYQEFLKHGPRYDDLFIVSQEGEVLANFNKLAGISSRPVSYNKVAGQAQSNWIFQF